MAKRVACVSLVVCCLVLFGVTENGFADAPSQLAEAEAYKEDGRYEEALSIYQVIVTDYPGTDYVLKAQEGQAIVYILIKEYDEAEAAVDKLNADFSEHPGLPTALYSIAGKYNWPGCKYEKAKNIYQQLVEQYPHSGFRRRAQLDALRMNILSLIESEQDEAAQTAIEQLQVDFSDDSRLPAALYFIAAKYEWPRKELEKAKGIYQQVIEAYPNSPYAGKAQLELAKMDVFALIEAGDDPNAAAIEKLSSDFSGHPDLAAVLYQIAGRYEWPGKAYGKARAIYQQIIQHYPGGSYANRAELKVAKIDILLLIQAGEDMPVQTAIDSLITDFNSHPDLPRTISQIEEGYFDRMLAAKKAGTVEFWHYGEPVALWEKVIGKYPDFFYDQPDLYYFIAYCYYKLGDCGEAMRYCDMVLENWPDWPHIGYVGKMMSYCVGGRGQ